MRSYWKCVSTRGNAEMIMNVFFIFMIITSIVCYFILGSLYCNRKNIQIEVYEWIFWSVVMCFYECIFIVFMMALCGFYSYTAFICIVAAKNMFLFIIIVQNKGKIEKIVWKKEFSLALLFAVILSFLIYFIFPTEYLWGRRDPIMYVIKGIEIAKSGGVKHGTSEFLNQHYEEIKGFVDLTYRGVYSDYIEGNSSLPGDISFQFLDFFPALLAIGYSIANLDGLFRINSLTGVLCILGIYFFGKRFGGKKVGMIAALFIAINPAQVWGARITQTELLFQLSWIIGANFFCIGWKNNNKVLMILSGGIIGFIGLNRIDSYILGVGIFGVAIFCNLFIPEKKHNTFLVAMSYFITAGISFLYSCIFSFYYIRDHWNEGVLFMLITCNIIFAAICLLAYIFKIKPITRLRELNFLSNICDSRSGRIIVCWILFWIARLLYYARPLLQKEINADFDFCKRSFNEFCWYTSTIAILFAIIGIGYIMKEKQKRRELLGFLAMGASSMMVYIYRPAVAPDHIWASRRWISVCIPFVLMLAAYGIEKFSELFKGKIKKVVLGICIFSICAFSLYQCRIFLFTPMLNEMQREYEDLNSHMNENEIYLAQESMFGSVLRFVYGKNVFVLKKDSVEEVVQYLEHSGNTLYYIGDIDLFEGKIEYEETYSCKISGTYIDQKMKEYPTELAEIGSITNIYRLQH